MNSKVYISPFSFRAWLRAAFACAALLGLSACSLMDDDRSDCPEGLFVGFVYDYNVQQADMFKDHVGGVTLYVFDEAGRLVTERSASNATTGGALATYGYQMNLTDLPAGTYSLVAVAGQRGYDELLSTPGAKFRRTALAPGDDRSQLRVTLDHNATPDTEGLCAVDASAPLDTLWMTLEAPTVELRAGCPAYATVPLVRDTKHLNLTLRQLDDPTGISQSDFDFRVVAANATVGHDNAVAAGPQLRYAPYALWDTEETLNTGGDARRVAHANLMFGRLMDHADPQQDARLIVTSRATGNEVININLPDFLLEGRSAPNFHFGTQEYLDRAYDYQLDFFLQGGTWVYAQLHVLSWSVRIDNINL